MPSIINPVAQRNREDYAKGRKMDVCQLARLLFVQHLSISPQQAFDWSELFKQEEELRYPPTPDRPYGDNTNV